MAGARDLKVIGGAIAVVVVLFGWWLTQGAFRDTTGEPTPGRNATGIGDSSAVEPTQQTTSADPTSPAATEPDAGVDPVSGLAWVALSELPPEVATTLDAIDDGPPYPYDRDGVTFENREGLLPDEQYGYYQEFTVETPGSDDRGARRVIWGLSDEFYYTDDHYATFSRISQ